jgi:DNA-binding response OmpR family regulator
MPSEQTRVLIMGDAFERDDQIDVVLTSAGFATRVVNDSASAIGAIDVWRPSVAVVDLRFPAREARQFCAELAERPNAGQLAIVLVGEGPNLLKPMAMVPSGLIATPIDADHLIATVLRVARRRRRAGCADLHMLMLPACTASPGSHAFFKAEGTWVTSGERCLASAAREPDHVSAGA